MLAKREHGIEELRAKLIRKGCSDSVVEDVVATLAAQQLISDRRFTEDLVRVRRNRGYGPLRIEQELRSKGVAEDDVTRWLARSSDDWTRLLREVRRKKFGARVPRSLAERAKQARFLHARGFSYEQIRSVFGGREEE